MRWVGAIMLLIGVATPSYPEAQPLKSNRLNSPSQPVASPVIDRAVAAARMDFQAESLDQFARATVDQKAAGSAAFVDVGVHDGNAITPCGLSAYFTYDRSQRLLRIQTSRRLLSTSRTVPIQHVFHYRCRSSSGAAETRQNSYGARIRVERERRRVDSVTLIGNDAEFTLDVVADPADARVIASDVIFRITGVVGALSSGGITKCAADFHGATFDRPEDIYIESCTVGIVASLVELRRRSTGAVLKEWRLEGATP